MSWEPPREGRIVVLPEGATATDPDQGGPTLADWSALLQVSPERVLVLPEVEADTSAARVARVCLAITSALPTPGEGIVLAAAGRAAAMLPSVGFAQRAAHRQVQAYVMALDSIDQVPAPGTTEWPDAPVWIRTTDDHVRSAAELRGWRLLA